MSSEVKFPLVEVPLMYNGVQCFHWTPHGQKALIDEKHFLTTTAVLPNFAKSQNCFLRCCDHPSDQKSPVKHVFAHCGRAKKRHLRLMLSDFQAISRNMHFLTLLFRHQGRQQSPRLLRGGVAVPLALARIKYWLGKGSSCCCSPSLPSFELVNVHYICSCLPQVYATLHGLNPCILIDDCVVACIPADCMSWSVCCPSGFHIFSCMFANVHVCQCA